MVPSSASSSSGGLPGGSSGQGQLDTTILVTHDAAPAAGPGQAFLTQLPLLVAIVAIFYFLIIRPQNQERKRHEALLAGLKKDDQVVTNSGLYGRVAQVKDGRIELEIAPKVRVWIEMSAVKRLKEDASATADADASSKEG